MPSTEDKVRSLLSAVSDPLLGRNYFDLGAIESIAVQNEEVKLRLRLGYLSPSIEAKVGLTLASQFQLAGFNNSQVDVVGGVKACPSQTGSGNLRQIKNIIMVASGKGGVGKSTTAANLALALKLEGAEVGLLDADIYGPSQRMMLGIAEDQKPQLVDEKFLQPMESMGIKSMSVGYLSEEKAPMIWRGPMATRMLTQLMEQTIWGPLDYLIVDMPPGTGDIQISLAQKLSISGAVIVTTPQEVALADAKKGIEMFNKVNIPILGVVENMATYACPKCGHEESIFGENGAQKMAQDYDVSVLGSLPLNLKIREDIDNGIPTVAADPMSTLSAAYTSLANQVAAQQWLKNIYTATPASVIIFED
jgi:ATP-binding protein involved in chromosome partitioning